MHKVGLLTYSNIFILILTSFFILNSFSLSDDTKKNKLSLIEECKKNLALVPHSLPSELLSATCLDAQILDSCKSEEGRSIFHFEKTSSNEKALKVLVYALTHGDEPESTSLAIHWTNRLRNLTPRSSWRIVPFLNPDGFFLKTRMNKNGVDINRNFPTKDWNPDALKRWKEREKSDPRRYPGPEASSEKETRCAIKHYEDFAPQFVISIHTPYGLLDFDGPKLHFPAYFVLPWKSLGHFPGSLGRYLWHERKVPVVTVELKSLEDFQDPKKIEELQDLLGTVAIQSQP